MAQTDKRIRWFHYSTEDAKAAQAELDQLAAEGWELAELGLLTATFRPASSPRPCWVEPARWRSMGRKDTERRADYLELCDEAGWDLLDESGGLWFFQAKPGTDPAPVQTDETVEWTSVWKKILFNQAFNLLFLGIFWTLHFWVQFVWKGFFLWEPLLSNTALGATVLFQVLLLAELIYGAYLLSYRRRCRRAVAAGESFPVPGRWGARLRGVSKLGAGVVLVGAFLLLLTGVGEGQAEYLKDHAGYTRQRRSVFAEQWTYRQFQSHGSLWVESYTCRFSWLAELICGDLLALEGDGEALEKDLHYHAPVTPAPAELGFDRAWTYHDGELSGLILQNGTQVVRIEAPDIDLTNPDILIELRQRILKLTEYGGIPMEQVLFVNACVRGEKSRTLKLARHFLEVYQAGHPDHVITECNLCQERLQPQYPEILAERDALWSAGKLDHPMFEPARRFAAAEHIVIAAPFWDLNYPALLKIYLERISVANLTFGYNDKGEMIGLCQAKDMIFITTRGGAYQEAGLSWMEMGARHLEALCSMYGIGRFQCLAVEGLDDVRRDQKAMMQAGLTQAELLAKEL